MREVAVIGRYGWQSINVSRCPVHLDRIVLVTKLERKPGIIRRLEATPAAARCQPGTSSPGRDDHGANPIQLRFRRLP